jgi:deazaflavin-dependent oxidoreductase (nitroreductase family)
MIHWQKKLEALKHLGTCRITTRGRKTGRPHSVPIWFVVGEERRIYLGTLRMGRDWPKNVAANPDVRLEVGDLRLEGEALRVTDEAQRANIESRLASKYWAAWIGSWLGLKPQGVFEVRIRGEAT